MLLYDQIQETLHFLKQKTNIQPKLGFILGTGLGSLAEDIDVSIEIPYKDIPHFPVSTVQSHKGKLIFGTLNGVNVVAMAGRFHYYEGYNMQEVTFPVRVMKFLGIKRLIVSNASGSVNPAMEAGDIVFIRDHINHMGANPLRGKNDERLGPRFPDMLKTYDRDLNAKAMAIATEKGIRAHQGIYLALQGPNLETPAEYKFFHRAGADLIGMSTVPEVLVAKHMALPLFVVSVVSNKCYPLEEIKEVSVETVIAMVEKSAAQLQEVIKELMRFF